MRGPFLQAEKGFVVYEKMKAGFFEYLNYKVWFNPGEMQQEEHEITY